MVQSDFFVSFLITVMDSKDFKHSHVNTVMKQILLSCRPSLSTRQSFIDIRLVSCFYKQFVCLDFTYRASFNQIFSVGSICLVLLVCAFIRPRPPNHPVFLFPNRVKMEERVLQMVRIFSMIYSLVFF